MFSINLRNNTVVVILQRCYLALNLRASTSQPRRVSNMHVCALGANVRCMNSQMGVISISLCLVLCFLRQHKEHLTTVSHCNDGYTGGSAFKQLTNVNRSDWHMSEAACGEAAAVGGWHVWQSEGLLKADASICVSLCEVCMVKNHLKAIYIIRSKPWIFIEKPNKSPLSKQSGRGEEREAWSIFIFTTTNKCIHVEKLEQTHG